MLGEMAAMMDLHHHRAHQQQFSQPESCPPPPQGPTRPAKAPTWAVSLSPAGSSGSSDDAAEIFPWSNELRQALRYRLQSQHHHSDEDVSHMAPLEPPVAQGIVGQIQSSVGRKRKIWDDLESLEVKSLPGQLEGVVALQQLQETSRPLSASHNATLHHAGITQVECRPPPTPRSALRARASRRDDDQGKNKCSIFSLVRVLVRLTIIGYNMWWWQRFVTTRVLLGV